MSTIEGYTSGGKVDVGWWQRQIEAGERYRKKYAHEDMWDTWRKYYRGEWANDVLPSNIYFKMLRTIVPRIYFRNPSISVRAAKPGLVEQVFAQILERVDNKLIRTMKMKKQLKMMAQDCFMFGTMVGKVGFGALYSPAPAELGSTSAPSPSARRKRIEYADFVKDDMPWFMRVHPGAFIVPDGCMDKDFAPWVAHWIRRPLDEVKADPRLKHRDELGPSNKPSDKGTTGIHNKPASSEGTTKMIDLYEVRDRRTGKVFIIAPYNYTDGELLIADDTLQDTGSFPFFTATFNPDDEVFWGVPDSKILDPIQRELNETNTQIMWHRRFSVMKLLYKTGVLTPTMINRIKSEEIIPAVEVDGDPFTDVRMMEGGGIPKDLIVSRNLSTNDARETLGFGRNQFGEFKEGSGDTTAYEAHVVQMASEIRVDERRDAIADMIVEIFQHIHNIIFTRWTDEQVVEIAGPGGLPVWVKFRGDMLKDTAYEINVDPDTSIPETKQVREQKALKVYALFQNDPLIDPVRLRRYLLHELHGVAFDDMMNIPPGLLGSLKQPLTIEQYVEVLNHLTENPEVMNFLMGQGQQPGQQGPQSGNTPGQVAQGQGPNTTPVQTPNIG